MRLPSFLSSDSKITEYTTNAPRGAEMLDRVNPGWASRINRKRLNMLSLRWCILGQLYGSFREGLAQLPYSAMGLSSSVDYGFVPYPQQEYRLRAEWLSLIRERTSR